jgi:hypothetical protein
MLSVHNTEPITQQIIILLKTILEQNYFTFLDNTYQPEKGVSMGSPLSNTIAEIFLQHLEQINLKQLLDANTITFYTRYVVILIVYNIKLISPVTICNQINKLHPNLIFSPTHEMNNTISFLDLQITRLPTTIDIDIYRKPTTTDTTINFKSNHPIEHKMADI